MNPDPNVLVPAPNAPIVVPEQMNPDLNAVLVPAAPPNALIVVPEQNAPIVVPEQVVPVPVLDHKRYGCTLCAQRFTWHLGALDHGKHHRRKRVYLCTYSRCGKTVSTDSVRTHVHVVPGTIVYNPAAELN